MSASLCLCALLAVALPLTIAPAYGTTFDNAPAHFRNRRALHLHLNKTLSGGVASKTLFDDIIITYDDADSRTWWKSEALAAFCKKYGINALLIKDVGRHNEEAQLNHIAKWVARMRTQFLVWPGMARRVTIEAWLDLDQFSTAETYFADNAQLWAVYQRGCIAGGGDRVINPNGALDGVVSYSGTGPSPILSVERNPGFSNADNAVRQWDKRTSTTTNLTIIHHFARGTNATLLQGYVQHKRMPLPPGAPPGSAPPGFDAPNHDDVFTVACTASDPASCATDVAAQRGQIKAGAAAASPQPATTTVGVALKTSTIASYLQSAMGSGNPIDALDTAIRGALRSSFDTDGLSFSGIQLEDYSALATLLGEARSESEWRTYNETVLYATTTTAAAAPARATTTAAGHGGPGEGTTMQIDPSLLSMYMMSIANGTRASQGANTSASASTTTARPSVSGSPGHTAWAVASLLAAAAATAIVFL